MIHQFETVSDSDLETVAGGLSFSVDFAKGISIESKLGSATLKLPKPSEVVGGLKDTVVATLDNVGKLTDGLGQLFDFI